jgi:hypothetical protein
LPQRRNASRSKRQVFVFRKFYDNNLIKLQTFGIAIAETSLALLQTKKKFSEEEEILRGGIPLFSEGNTCSLPWAWFSEELLEGFLA